MPKTRNRIFPDVIRITQLTAANFDTSFIKACSIDGIPQYNRFEQTRRYKFLRGYLFWDDDGLKAKTMIEENDYYSLSYAGDYKNYYAQCFAPYEKICKRVHFFNNELTEESLEELLNDKNRINELTECYLGSIIIKPLSEGYLGATLLKPYDSRQKKSRFYTAIRNYKINLFGRIIELKSLIFQEQDQLLVNCSTLSLWFAFNKTGEIFQTKIPHPSDITLSAGVNFNHHGWYFPSVSLSVEQIGKAINANDMLSTILVKKDHLQDDQWIKSFIYAYSRAGIPILLGMVVKDYVEVEHMVTINGYRFNKNAVDTSNPYTQIRIKPSADQLTSFGSDPLQSLQLASDDIIKFYAHDDQVGPFTRFEFIRDLIKSRRNIRKSGIKTRNPDEWRYQLRVTCWTEQQEEEKVYDSYARLIAVPLVKSILLNYQAVIGMVARINSGLLKFWKLEQIAFDFFWDVYLDSGRNYKTEIRNHVAQKMYDRIASKILYKAMPEYLWVVRCCWVIEDVYVTLAFDILYDASDMDMNNIFYTNFYNGSVKGLMKKFGLVIKKDKVDTVDLSTLLSKLD